MKINLSGFCQPKRLKPQKNKKNDTYFICNNSISNNNKFICTSPTTATS